MYTDGSYPYVYTTKYVSVQARITWERREGCGVISSCLLVAIRALDRVRSGWGGQAQKNDDSTMWHSERGSTLELRVLQITASRRSCPCSDLRSCQVGPRYALRSFSNLRLAFGKSLSVYIWGLTPPQRTSKPTIPLRLSGHGVLLLKGPHRLEGSPMCVPL
jgi:hypothetical protein